MSLNRLKTLIAIAESGSFVAAADRIFLTPAAVGQQMRALEEEFGVALFDRNKRSPQLTPVGRALVDKARGIVNAYGNMVPSLIGALSEFQEISIGAVPTTMIGLVPKALTGLRADHANLHIKVQPGLSADLLPMVEQGYLDAAIISEPRHIYDHVEFCCFAEEPLVVLTPADCTADDPVELLETAPFIRFSRRAWVGQQIDDWLRQQKIKVNESMELDTLEAISTMVHHGLGISIVPKSCVPGPRPLALKQIRLDPPAKPRLLGMLFRPDNPKFKLVSLFLTELNRLVELNAEINQI